jgi:hypothetical protein
MIFLKPFEYFSRLDYIVRNIGGGLESMGNDEKIHIDMIR